MPWKRAFVDVPAQTIAKVHFVLSQPIQPDAAAQIPYVRVRVYSHTRTRDSGKKHVGLPQAQDDSAASTHLIPPGIGTSSGTTEPPVRSTVLLQRYPTSPRTTNEIVHGKRSITTSSALRLAKFFGTSPAFWLNLQTSHDPEEARESVDLEDVKVMRVS